MGLRPVADQLSRERSITSSTSRSRRRSRRGGLGRASRTRRRDLSDDPVALRARGGSLAGARVVVSRRQSAYAEVAYPFPGVRPRAMFAAPLDDQLQTVAVVRRRVFVAGGIATRRSRLCSGTPARAVFTRRIRSGSRPRRTGSRPATSGSRSSDPARGRGWASSRRSFERMRLRLADLDRARGEFIANASHELRTPLFSLGGFLELLEDTGPRRGDARGVPRRRCASRSTA